MSQHAHLQEAEFFIETNRFKDAKKALQLHLQSNFEDEEALALLGLCELELNALDAALNALKQSLSLEPNYDYAHFLLGHVYFTKENWKAAEESLRLALEINPYKAHYFSLLARIQYNSGKYKSCNQSIREGMQIDPNHPDLLEIKALSELKFEATPEALQSIKQGLKEDPQNPQLLSLMGTYHLNKKNHLKAKEFFSNALQNNPNLESAREGLMESQKVSSWLFRIFFEYGFSRWQLKFGWWMLIWVLIGIKTVFIWGFLFIGFLMFTWYGDVLYNSVLRIGKTSRYLLTKNKIEQSNFFLGANALILVLIISANLFGVEMIWRLLMLTFMILFMGIAWYQVQLKRQRNQILTTAIILIGLSFLAFGVEDLFGFGFTIMCLTIVFGLLFSFRIIGW